MDEMDWMDRSRPNRGRERFTCLGDSEDISCNLMNGECDTCLCKRYLMLKFVLFHVIEIRVFGAND